MLRLISNQSGPNVAPSIQVLKENINEFLLTWDEKDFTNYNSISRGSKRKQ